MAARYSFGTKIFLLCVPKNVARENFRFGSGSKKFSRHEEKILAPLFPKTRAAIRAIMVRENQIGIYPPKSERGSYEALPTASIATITTRQFDLSGNRKVRVSDDFNIEFRLFRQDVVSDDTGDQVGDKIVDTAMSRVLYLTDIFEHIIDRFDQGSLSQ